MKAALIWDPAFVSYRFKPDHPFNPRRLELTVSLIEELGLLDPPDFWIEPPRPATEDELLLVHSRDFIDAVQRYGQEGASAEGARKWGLGTDDNPIFPGMHEATAIVVGGTLRAAELVMEQVADRSFAIAGGLHHAHRDRASGFCLYSDLAVAIAWIRKEYDARVMYIDYDAHHGDGVQSIFYDDPNVLTLSLHESGRYLFPGTGFVDELGEGEGYGYSLNLPMEPQTEDRSWLGIYEQTLNEFADAFQPDVIVLQNGCDAHVLDPLTHLRCTTRLYEETVRMTSEIAERHCEGRLIGTGGGGYAIWRVVPRAWTLVWAGLTQQTVPNRVPHQWIERWQGESPCLLSDELRDAAEAFPPAHQRAEASAVNQRAFESLRRAALPLLRGWSREF